MTALLKIAVILPVVILGGACASFGEGAIFGVLSKSVDDQNFIDVQRGCQDAALPNGDCCIHIGGEGAAAPRKQVAALENALGTESLSAIAVSVVMSDLLAEVVRRSVRVPVITFDSPFSGADADLSRAYVGTDNFAFGRELAKIVKQLRPQGGAVFMMGDMHDTNLAQRVLGVRRELSGDSLFPDGRNLNGEGGWTESARSPWNSGDDVDRTMQQLTLTFGEIQPDVFISVGHWPLVDTDAYRKAVFPYREGVRDKLTLVVVGVGKIFPEHRQLVAEGLVHGVVSIDFYKTGQLCYRLMRALSHGEAVPATTYIPTTVLMGR